MLSKKDLIALNKEFHIGRIANEGSLEFALDQAKRTKDWLKATAYLVRAIVVDHIFEDGNKRTAAGVMATCINLQHLDFDKERVDQVILNIAKKSPKNLGPMMRMMKNAIK